MDVRSAPALEFEKPEHTHGRDLTAQCFTECFEVSLYIVAIVGELSGVRQGQHSSKLYIGVGRYKSKALP